MPARRPVAIGDIFDRLTVISRAPPQVNDHGHYQYRVNVRCQCGNQLSVDERHLKSGNTTSCGCRRSERHAGWVSNLRHGMAGTPTHRSWRKMRERCDNPSNIGYYLYGARGIKVCDRWQSFENFLADMGTRPVGTSLERTDNSRNYEPENCRWATPSEQTRNTSRNKFVMLHERRLCLADATTALGLHSGSITQRARDKGTSLQEATDHFAAKQAKS